MSWSITIDTIESNPTSTKNTVAKRGYPISLPARQCKRTPRSRNLLLSEYPAISVDASENTTNKPEKKWTKNSFILLWSIKYTYQGFQE